MGWRVRFVPNSHVEFAAAGTDGERRIEIPEKWVAAVWNGLRRLLPSVKKRQAMGLALKAVARIAAGEAPRESASKIAKRIVLACRSVALTTRK